MRFLFGIITGAAMTLLIATTADAPTSPVVNKLNGIWQELIKASGDHLFRHQTSTDITALESDTTGQPDHSLPIAPPREAKPTNNLASTAEPDSQRPAKTEQTDASDSFERIEPQSGTPAPTPLTPPPIEPQLVQSTSQNTEAENTPADDQLAAVWVPFHSERSASGFARSLSRHFEYPFSVRRTGPGAYQVIFPYADTTQRENLLLEITELTGQ